MQKLCGVRKTALQLCVMVVHQLAWEPLLEASGVRPCWQGAFGPDRKFLFPLLSGSASFSLCCADEFKKNETACCPQIEYFAPALVAVEHSCVG